MFPRKAREWLSVSTASLLLLPSLIFATGQSPQGLVHLREQLHIAPTVEYCELTRHDENYDGKVIRVRGVYITDFEASTISSPACDVPFSSFVGQTWVDFDAAFDKLTDRKLRKKLENSKWRTGLDVVFVGRFESTSRDGTRGFGHQDMYGARLVVMSVEQVQSLGKFSSLPGVALESEPPSSNAPPQVTLCEA